MKSLLKPAALFAAAFVFGAIGLRWDQPSEKRAARVLDPRWDRAALLDNLAGGWEEIYKQAEGSSPLAAEAAGKYSTRLKGRFSTDFKNPLPEPELWNSYRSILIRSRYPDEALPLSDLARMKPAELKFRPPSFIYGGGYLYPLGAYYFALSKLKAVEPLPLRAALERTDTLGSVYLAGRLLSAAAFAGICLLVFLIVNRLEPGAAPYAAYAAVLFMPVLGIHARYLTPHLWAAFWGISAVYLSIRALPDMGLKPLLAAGACLGLASGSYWSAAHTGLFMLAVLSSAGRDALKSGALKKFAFSLIVCCSVFVAVNPYLLFNLAEVAREFAPEGVASLPHRGHGLQVLLASIFPTALGPAFALLLPAGCIWGLFSGRPLLRNLSAAFILFAIPAALVLPPEFPAGVRRFFPWLIIGTVTGSIFLSRLTARLGPAFRTAVFIMALIPGFIMSAAYALSFIDASGRHSTYRRMADTLDSLPAGLTLGMTEFPQPSHTPVFRMDRWKLRLADPGAMQALSKKELPEYILADHSQYRAIAGLLGTYYELAEGFYPRRLFGFTPRPLLCGANAPVELFRLKEAR